MRFGLFRCVDLGVGPGRASRRGMADVRLNMVHVGSAKVAVVMVDVVVALREPTLHVDDFMTLPVSTCSCREWQQLITKMNELLIADSWISANLCGAGGHALVDADLCVGADVHVLLAGAALRHPVYADGFRRLQATWQSMASVSWRRCGTGFRVRVDCAGMRFSS